jgi:hypothetical protein
MWAYVAWKLDMWDLFTLDVVLGAIQTRLLYHAAFVKFGLVTAVFKHFRRVG